LKEGLLEIKSGSIKGGGFNCDKGDFLIPPP